MAKIDWKEYMDKYLDDTTAFAATASSKLPKGMVYDKTGNRLPTPYALFSEWCSSDLSGDWAIMKTKGGFVVCTADSYDAREILGEFRATMAAKKTKASKTTHTIGYTFSQYTRLAGKLGYVL